MMLALFWSYHSMSARLMRYQIGNHLGSASVELDEAGQIISYEEYLQRFVDQEYNTDTSLHNLPRYVFRAPDLEYGVSPAPDQTYTLTYEYYLTTTDLSSYDDVPSVPEMYRHVIVDGAMYHAYMFRGNTQDAIVAKDKFMQGIKNMRIILINRYDYVRSTAINRSRLSSYVYRLS